jgi:hypothetical protein
MAARFSHDDAFPVIARLISTIYQRTGDYVTHDEIVQEMLSDTLGKSLIENALNEDDAEKTGEWWASNMVQWFSQRITEEKSEYAREFERTKIEGAWAYRPSQ